MNNSQSRVVLNISAEYLPLILMDIFKGGETKLNIINPKQLKPMPIFEIIVLVAVLALTLYFGRDYMNDDF